MARLFHIPYRFYGKLKEIDIVAGLGAYDESGLEGLATNTWTQLIIECKKSEEKPWVFFSVPEGSGRSDASVRTFTKYTSDLDSYFKTEGARFERGRSPLLARIAPLCRQNHYADASIPRCVAYVEAFKNPDKPSEIYAALDSVLSFIHYLSLIHI